ncbi:SGNH/GDSL hydrolase family protein [Caldimonas tepidiphila]|uniref:SGNH/GDSL hydrolase family protein n=1 Tax=Caldimonas tepidiphila TaxID=2315841 RepID=UPI000E5B32A1|nr:SGNH/GDSL hydrolase family protein [Caldimonas tepidiphila]
MRSFLLVLLSALFLNAQAVPLADAPGAAERWAESFAGFDEADRRAPPPSGGVLFVGSSSIRMWDGLEASFGDGPPVIKRGFGGSQMADCARHLERLVTRYRPQQVFVYAGENDLAEGRTPQQVLESFASFADGVQRALPGTRIVYLSIKPSPLREALLPQVREANRLIERHVAARPHLAYIDLHTPMLGADGRPRAELFGADRLHLNAQGYRLWQQLIAAHLL